MRDFSYYQCLEALVNKCMRVVRHEINDIYPRGCLFLCVYTSTAISSVESGIRPNSVLVRLKCFHKDTPQSNVRAVYVLLLYQCLVLHKLVLKVLIDR